MTKDHPAERYISVLMARDGGTIIYQGFYHQALFVARDDIPRFATDPLQTRLRVIPPLAALALHCYTSLEEIETIHTKAINDLPDYFALTFRTKSGKSIRYVSQHDFLPSPRQLAEERIAVVVTPKLAAFVEHDGARPAFAPVVQMPDAETPDYKRRFAHEPHLLAEAVSRTLAERWPALRYAN